MQMIILGYFYPPMPCPECKLHLNTEVFPIQTILSSSLSRSLDKQWSDI